MEKEKDIIIIVCGYPFEGSELIEYLWPVSLMASELDPRCKLIMACGGKTRRNTNNGKTEAMAMVTLLSNLPLPKNVSLVAEEKSFSAFQNLRNARIALNKHPGIKPENDEIIIVCDAVKAIQVKYAARLKFFPGFTVRVKTYDVLGSGKELWEALNTVYDILSIWLPPLQWLKLAVKKIIARHS